MSSYSNFISSAHHLSKAFCSVCKSVILPYFSFSTMYESFSILMAAFLGFFLTLAFKTFNTFLFHLYITGACISLFFIRSNIPIESSLPSKANLSISISANSDNTVPSPHCIDILSLTIFSHKLSISYLRTL